MILGFLADSSAGAIASGAVKSVSDTLKAAAANVNNAASGNWIIEHAADSHTLDFFPFSPTAGITTSSLIKRTIISTALANFPGRFDFL